MPFPISNSGRRCVSGEGGDVQQSPAEGVAAIDRRGIAEHRFELGGRAEGRDFENVEVRLCGEERLQYFVLRRLDESFSAVDGERNRDGARAFRTVRVGQRRIAREHRLHRCQIAGTDRFQKIVSANAGRATSMVMSKAFRMMKSSAAQRTRGAAEAHVPLGASARHVTSGLFTLRGRCVILPSCRRRASSAWPV